MMFCEWYHFEELWVPAAGRTLSSQALGGNRCDRDGKATVKRAELTPDPLLSVRAKIARADEHLSTIRRLDGEFETVDCHVMFTEDRERNLGYFVIQMPEPPLELSAVVG